MANKDFNIRIKVDDGKAKVQIDGLTKGFVNVETAVSKLNSELRNNSQALEGTARWYKQQISLLKEQRDATAKTAEDYARQTKAIEQVQIRYRALSSDVSQFNKVNEDQISNAGLAGATLTELGRTVSDLPYGFRGIANNLSQLSTLFITLTAKTKGFSNSIGLLLKQLRGPLGFVLAFQAVISLLDFFSQKTSQATDEIDGLSDALKDEIAALIVATTLFETGALTAEKNAEIISELNKEYDDLNLTLDEFGNVSSESVDQLRAFTDEAVRAAVVQSTLADIVELTKQKAVEQQKALMKGGTTMDSFKIAIRKLTGQEGSQGLFGVFATTAERSANNIQDLDDQIDILKNTITDSEFLDALKTVLMGGDDDDSEDALKGTIQYYKELISELKKEQETVVVTAERYKELQVQIDAYQESINILRGVVTEQTEEEKNAAKELLDFKKSLTEQEEDFEDETAIQKIDRRQERHLQELETLEINEIEKQELIKRIEDYYESLRERQREVDAAKAKAQRDKMMAQRFDDLARLFGEEEKMGKAALLLKMNFANIEKAINDGITWQSLKNSIVTGTTNFFEGIQTSAKAAPFPANIALIAGHIATASPFLLQLKAAVDLFKGKKEGSAPSVSTGGLSAGGSIQAPDFNVVGASAQSQLAEAVGMAESQPVRAYVVGKDISTQQELDRNITNTASFN